jgi:hypothetical protein
MSVNQWVADKLHDLVGYSDKVVAEFIVDSARKAASPAALLTLLTDTDTIQNTAKSFVKRFTCLDIVLIAASDSPSLRSFGPRYRAQRKSTFVNELAAYRTDLPQPVKARQEAEKKALAQQIAARVWQAPVRDEYVMRRRAMR